MAIQSIQFYLRNPIKHIHIKKRIERCPFIGRKIEELGIKPDNEMFQAHLNIHPTINYYKHSSPSDLNSCGRRKYKACCITQALWQHIQHLLTPGSATQTAVVLNLLALNSGALIHFHSSTRVSSLPIISSDL